MSEAENKENFIPKRALLVSVYSGPANLPVCIEHLNELELLCRTYGINTVEMIPCQIRKFEASTYVTKGKLEELLARAKEVDADVIIFDDEISPAQQRNLEEFFGTTVMDRTKVILDVFAQRAHTKEAQLQIELAKVKYDAPRLKRLWTHLSRQTGTGGSGSGGAYLKGEGEKQIEIDRRILKKRISRLQDEIAEVHANRITQRVARNRSGIPVFAIVGYTNAGKSTLLNAMTDAGVFVEDKLFATLDTTTRKFTLKNNQEVLLIDTVGFIRKLPHLLVAAFKSTLEEALQADFLLHLVDASHPMAEEHAATTMEVLKELGAHSTPIITVLNKVDKLGDGSVPQIHKLRLKYPKAIQISALNKVGLLELQEMMIEEIKKLRQRVKLKIPQKEYHLVAEAIRTGSVIYQDFEDNDVIIDVELPTLTVTKLKNYIIGQ